MSKPLRKRPGRRRGQRWKDGDNYTWPAPSSENNVSLYYTARIRKTLKYVDAVVPAGQWHAAGRVRRHDRRSLDGKRYIDFSDEHITGAGSVGVWTKADSVTAFSEFAHQAARP
jgi:hypothetical protein